MTRAFTGAICGTSRTFESYNVERPAQFSVRGGTVEACSVGVPGCHPEH
jgi:hypothetical protein